MQTFHHQPPCDSRELWSIREKTTAQEEIDMYRYIFERHREPDMLKENVCKNPMLEMVQGTI